MFIKFPIKTIVNSDTIEVNGCNAALLPFVTMCKKCYQQLDSMIPPIMLVPTNIYFTIDLYDDNLRVNLGKEYHKIGRLRENGKEYTRICISYADLSYVLSTISGKVVEENKMRHPEQGVTVNLTEYSFQIKISELGVLSADTWYSGLQEQTEGLET